jgi:hypothetical protein
MIQAINYWSGVILIFIALFLGMCGGYAVSQTKTAEEVKVPMTPEEIRDDKLARTVFLTCVIVSIIFLIVGIRFIGG